MRDKIGQHRRFDMNATEVIYAEGEEACANGEFRNTCPYLKESRNAAEWLRGFDDMQIVRDEWEESCG